MDGKREAVTINKWSKKKVTLEEAKIVSYFFVVFSRCFLVLGKDYTAKIAPYGKPMWYFSSVKHTLNVWLMDEKYHVHFPYIKNPYEIHTNINLRFPSPYVKRTFSITLCKTYV
jgi:hypothetical protein